MQQIIVNELNEEMGLFLDF